MKLIRSEQAAPPRGHHSHGIVHGGTVYVSGQLGRGPGMTDGEAGDIKAQTRDLHFGALIETKAVAATG